MSIPKIESVAYQICKLLETIYTHGLAKHIVTSSHVSTENMMKQKNTNIFDIWFQFNFSDETETKNVSVCARAVAIGRLCLFTPKCLCSL